MRFKEFVTPAAAKAALATVNMEVGLDYWLPWDTLVSESGKERAAQNHTSKNEAVRTPLPNITVIVFSRRLCTILISKN